jgi:L-seryl-tRNA(Ser) seleniumtransferase
MVAAVDWLLSQTDETLDAEFRGRADRIARQLKGIPSLETQIAVPPVANHVPHLLIRYDQNRVKIAPREVLRELRAGTPSIELNPSTGSARPASAGMPGGPDTIVVGVWMLEPGEDLIVARRLHEVLTRAARA